MEFQDSDQFDSKESTQGAVSFAPLRFGILNRHSRSSFSLFSETPRTTAEIRNEKWPFLNTSFINLLALWFYFFLADLIFSIAFPESYNRSLLLLCHLVQILACWRYKNSLYSLEAACHQGAQSVSSNIRVKRHGQWQQGSEWWGWCFIFFPIRILLQPADNFLFEAANVFITFAITWRAGLFGSYILVQHVENIGYGSNTEQYHKFCGVVSRPQAETPTGKSSTAVTLSPLALNSSTPRPSPSESPQRDAPFSSGSTDTKPEVSQNFEIRPLFTAGKGTPPGWGSISYCWRDFGDGTTGLQPEDAARAVEQLKYYLHQVGDAQLLSKIHSDMPWFVDHISCSKLTTEAERMIAHTQSADLVYGKDCTAHIYVTQSDKGIEDLKSSQPS